ncbi:MAG TPA: bifunctional diaminohydroxyphosphoribosylaminopyrimidine deaminase/5-amino-6-(5-phosphoribosylamino)uracil reductase RibD [Chitinophagaceae bacterium]|nr:bifunctional diaminohydroxyphosphoribosylaminopyrimidine deaminase/5-amino-6-(5-phosphoribosylamino)uracil reductase RibD [Chitinophagaceae bacterium]
MQYSEDEKYMARCLDLAIKAYNNAAPNPLVGAVLVYNNKIIGSGYHKQYGQAHAEVNCLQSVREKDKKWISKSTLYVSLEPCSFHGNTPACSQLIIDYKIPKVVIACLDPHPKVSGNGVKQLKKAGIEVITGILEKESLFLNRKAFTSYIKKRPYITLKWAETANRYFAPLDKSRKMISNTLVRYFVHDLRRKHHSILVAYKTAKNDNPALTNRYWKGGQQPIRIILDYKGDLPKDLQVFDGKIKTLHFIPEDSKNVYENEININHLVLNFNTNDSWENLLEALHKMKIQSLFIEGGAYTLQQFINRGLWDEAIQIQSNYTWDEGLFAPQLKSAILYKRRNLNSNTINFWRHEQNDYIL